MWGMWVRLSSLAFIKYLLTIIELSVWTKAVLGLIFIMNTNQLNFFSRVCSLDPNLNNALSLKSINLQAKIIIAERTGNSHKFTGSEYFTQYLNHNNVYYSDSNFSSIGIPTRGTLSKGAAYIDGMSSYKPHSLQDVVRFERLNKLKYLDDWGRNVSNEEFYRILYELPNMRGRMLYRELFNLPEETAESFIPSVAHWDHLVRLSKKVIESLEKPSNSYSWCTPNTHESNFYIFISRYYTLLNDIAAFKNTLAVFNIDWTHHRYLISRAYRNEALITRFNEVYVGDYRLLHSNTRLFGDVPMNHFVDTTHYASHVFVNEALIGVDATMELTHVFSFLV